MKIAVPGHVLVRVFENESVILNLNTESYHGLDDVGTRMWTALTSSASIQEAFEALLSEYQVEPAQLRQDLDDFLETLGQRGMVELVAG
ncbi:MAG: PqqD family protein [Deltaproteobacteria bacterium]|nr:PqqD family protein [Deltaproteobacteria bacterium]